MAITITQSPQGIYPAFNDSYISFTSSLSGLTKANINVEPSELFPKPFVIYPNTNGRYIFNLKDIVKSRLTVNGFDDINDIPYEWNQEITNNYLEQTINITDFNVVSGSTSSGATTELTYEFDKSVKQVGEPLFSNPYQLLNHSTNGLDYHLTYAQGFPFSFELQRVTAGDTINVKNVGSNITESFSNSGDTNTHRIYVDKAVSNWTSTNFFPLSTTTNLIEISQNSTFRTNLHLKKIVNKCGYYLKWFNQNGGYSYWLFDEFSKEDVSGKTLKDITTNPFKNVGEGLQNNITTIGYEAVKKLELKTRVDENEREILKSLFTSPSVQLYSSQIPFNNGTWINVLLNGKYEIFNKKSLNEIKVKIELPALNTQTL
ncbi:hypothetical protein [Bizionia psychrotolerans]|uniref:hypothetical protein n=1 Tax=Bizionia psychrotolerans TaxID=1492901 RepID=UPI0006520385|nr:hypothetical protein [Bizionia psychrotolerans]